jgi:hypothetical protein
MSTEATAIWRTSALAAAPGRNAQPFSVTYNCFMAFGVSGSQRYHTVLSLVNSSGREISVLAEFFALDGSPLSLPFHDQNGAFSGFYASASGTLPAGVAAGPSLMQSFNALQAGWVRITTDTPNGLFADSFVSVQDTFRTGVFVHSGSRTVSYPVEIGIENSPSSKKTWIGIVNPTSNPVRVALTPRTNTGSNACATFTVLLPPGQEIWRTAQSLVTCVPSGAPAYTLRLEPLDGEVVVQAYYDYANLLYATAPVHEVAADTAPGAVITQRQAPVKAPDTQQ